MNKFLKALACIDLWIVIVSATVFVTLYFIHQYIFLNEILIFMVIFLSFNILCCIPFGINSFKDSRHGVRKEEINY